MKVSLKVRTRLVKCPQETRDIRNVQRIGCRLLCAAGSQRGHNDATTQRDIVSLSSPVQRIKAEKPNVEMRLIDGVRRGHDAEPDRGRLRHF